MKSLQDVFSPEEVADFGARMDEALHNAAYSVEPKVDGLSVALEYRDGRLSAVQPEVTEELAKM